MVTEIRFCNINRISEIENVKPHQVDRNFKPTKTIIACLAVNRNYKIIKRMKIDLFLSYGNPHQIMVEKSYILTGFESQYTIRTPLRCISLQKSTG